MEMKNLHASDLVTKSAELSMHVKLFECLLLVCVYFNREKPWQKILNVEKQCFFIDSLRVKCFVPLCRFFSRGP